MEAVRPVKPLKLRLNGGHRNAQLPCDLVDPQIAGGKVKDLRLAVSNLNARNVFQILWLARPGHTPTNNQSRAGRQVRANVDTAHPTSRLGWLAPKVIPRVFGVNAHLGSALVPNMTCGYR
jgi:hypothetical protein